MTAVVAVLSHQIGELKQTVMTAINDINSQLRSHGKRIGTLEEQEIRREEREKAEDRLREVLKEERQEHEQATSNRITLSLARWQLVVAVLTGIAIVAAGVVAVLQAL
jgi:predicted Holliday junction resolvase-like endonuclease